MQPTDKPTYCNKRFWKKVNKTNTCWEWLGYKNQHGYGRTYVTLPDGSHKLMQVHRLSYEHHKGEIAPGLVVMHACDNRCCVNPDHLSLGTQFENLADMRSKGREGGIVCCRSTQS